MFDNPANLSMDQVRRMVEREVARQVPPIPKHVASLDDHQRPLVRPDVATDGMILTYDRDTDDWVPSTAASVTDPTVIAPTGETWDVALVDVVIDPANLASNASQTHTVSITGLLVGDYCFFLGSTSTSNSQIFATNPVCTIDGQISLKQFNANSSAVDVASNTFSFFVIHRS